MNKDIERVITRNEIITLRDAIAKGAQTDGIVWDETTYAATVRTDEGNDVLHAGVFAMAALANEPDYGSVIDLDVAAVFVEADHDYLFVAPLEFSDILKTAAESGAGKNFGSWVGYYSTFVANSVNDVLTMLDQFIAVAPE